MSGVKLISTGGGSVTLQPPSTASTVTLTLPGTDGTLVTSSSSTPQVIDVSSSSAALRITQTGTGNALLVEDSANPDTTPFVIDNTGRIVTGYSAALSNYYAGGALRTPQFQIQGASTSFATQSITNWAAGTTATGAPYLVLAKSLSNSVGTQGALTAADQYTGVLQFSGDDGTSFIPSAWIRSATDGTPGTNDMPGRLEFATTADGASSPTERMRIDASGNVGIGTSSPSYTLDVATTAGVGRILGSGTAGLDTRLIVANSGNGGAGRGAAISFQPSGLANTVEAAKICGLQEAPSATATAAALTFQVANTSAVLTERMRIDSSGNLLVGTTGANNGRLNVVPSDSAGYCITATIQSNGQVGFYGSYAAATGTAYYGYWRYNGTVVGAITSTGTTTTYATSSDYRLKENIQPMQNALATVAQLNPVTYNWKADGSDGQGFIAHELQAVVPDCVTGEKDAVDEEGKPVYQGVDTSFLVATLTKAIQELVARVEQLEAKNV